MRWSVLLPFSITSWETPAENIYEKLALVLSHEFEQANISLTDVCLENHD